MQTICFFNFGKSCVLELLVALYTLRKQYSGHITVCLLKNDKWNEILAPQLDKFGVNIHWVDIDLTKRNSKCYIKPLLFKYLFENTQYTSVIMCDGDLLFLRPIDSLWQPLEDKGCLLTQFCDWRTNGPIMSGRIKQLNKVLNEEQIKKLCDDYPAINIGVMGFTKDKGGKAFRKWSDLTKKVAGIHLADEIAAAVVPPYYDCFIAGAEYNASAKFSNMDTIEYNTVVHYHGGSQGGGPEEAEYETRRRSSRLWFATLNSLINSNICKIDEWIPHAKGGVHSILNANKELLEQCTAEFSI
jgi:hypothetical protein